MPVAALQQLAQERVDSAPDLVRAIGERLRLPNRLIDRLIEALREDELGEAQSLFDVVNAFSRVGTHLDRLSPATRRFLLEMSGGLIAERMVRCPTCGALRRERLRLLPRR